MGSYSLITLQWGSFWCLVLSGEVLRYSPSPSSEGKSFTHLHSHPSLPTFTRCWAIKDICLLWANVWRFTGDTYQRKLNGESFGVRGQTLPQGKPKQDLAVSRFLLYRLITARISCFFYSSSKRRNFYKVLFKTHLLDANSRSTTTFEAHLLVKNTCFP